MNGRTDQRAYEICIWHGRELTDDEGNMDLVSFEHAIRRQARTRENPFGIRVICVHGLQMWLSNLFDNRIIFEYEESS